MEYSPAEFFSALIGYNEERAEEWKVARYLSWYALVAQRGSKDLPTLKDWIEPKVEEVKIDKAQISQAFEYLNKTWIKP